MQQLLEYAIDSAVAVTLIIVSYAYGSWPLWCVGLALLVVRGLEAGSISIWPFNRSKDDA